MSSDNNSEKGNIRRVCSSFSARQKDAEPYLKRANYKRFTVLFSYFVSILCASMIFLTPLNQLVPRFGALIILLPTILTGWHILSINWTTNGLNTLIAGAARNIECDACTELYDDMNTATSTLGTKLRQVILCETVLATAGTFIWAFGDCVTSEYFNITRTCLAKSQ